VAIAASYRSAGWAAAPALLTWSISITAAAICDAITQRIPTSLVRRGGAITAVLLLAGLSAQRDWRGLATTAIAAGAATVVLLLAWRFAGAGFGDVRLAALGGLGLGHATARGLLTAVFVFCAITVAQALIALLHGGDRHTTIPYGPALAVAFLTAAA
jgi:leader peptidase (prepilin peptidase)/N-methyltransferase